MPKKNVEVPQTKNLGRETLKRHTSRCRLIGLLWDKNGKRRLPSEKKLIEAIHACDSRDLWWICEMNNISPLYLLPTKEWISFLSKFLFRLKVKKILEIGAGDGFLSESLSKKLFHAEINATDNKSWEKPETRMNSEDRRLYEGLKISGLKPGNLVKKMNVQAAIKQYRPDIVLVSWPPPGLMVEKAIKSDVNYVLEISVDGNYCGNGPYTRRFTNEILDGPLESHALCRLDNHPEIKRHTRVILYYGKKHPDFYEAR